MSRANIPATASTLSRLPVELLDNICQLLSNRDIKNLRLASRSLNKTCALSIKRVFISPNQRNIEVLYAIASHQTFRLGVEEIIWDDATLRIFKSDDERSGLDPDQDEDPGDEEQDLAEWYPHWCAEYTKTAKSRIGGGRTREAPRPDTIARQHQIDKAMSAQASLEYYKTLAVQQRRILASREDEDVFRYALRQFPRLSRVTVTPAAHGYLFEPLYGTPMIRAFPYGFVYPIPRGWPDPECGFDRPEGTPWDSDELSEEEKCQWHGYSTVTRILAEEPHQVSELICDNHHLPTGIDRMALEPGGPTYKSLCQILKRPGFKKFQFSLLMGYMKMADPGGWARYPSKHLHDALAQAPGIEHVSLQTDYCEIYNASGGDTHQFVSLFDIFPVHLWTNLQHFGLCNMHVTQKDLISFLGKLPPTLKSVELSCLCFLEDQTDYRGLLSALRDQLDWRSRPLEGRIRVQVKIYSYQSFWGRYICLDKEVNEYIYGVGPMPFEDRVHVNGPRIHYGAGMQRDEFNPFWERPWNRSPALRNWMQGQKHNGINHH